MLDKQMLEAMPPGTIFATGLSLDLGGNLRVIHGEHISWVAKRGRGPCDWSIYCYLGKTGHEFIAENGDIVHVESNIRLCVPCDDESLTFYRR